MALHGLNLSRNVGEQIVIGGDIIITVIKVRGKGVMLNINAPRDKRVDRMEIHERRNATLDADDVDDAGRGGLI